MIRRVSRFAFGALMSVLLVASTAQAQDAGIAGIVKDNSGAVIPGATVTAASPVLIEQQRSVVSDSEGRYIITQLRPGVYTVTFTLPGFSTVIREGIQLSAGFTANVDAELRPGGIAETITVTGASPVVDVTNVRRQSVVTNELLEALPTSTKSLGTLATLTLGMTGISDVGGSYQVEPGQDVVSGGGRFHGKGGSKVSYDGMGMENSSGNNSYQLNAASIEEMVISTSGISADTNADGMVMNVVPKEGGNVFRTILSGMFTNSELESTNLTPELRARGLSTANKTIKLFDESASIGGPIKKDQMWFFVAPRSWGLARSQAGTYWNKTQNVHLTPPGAERTVVLWTPWVDRPEDRLSGRLEWYDSILSRVTWQATTKNKFNFTYDEQRACNCGSVSAAQSHEFYLSSYRFEPNRLFQTTWSSPITSRLLLEAGFAATISTWNMYYNPGVTNDIISITDSGFGISYGSPTSYLGHPNQRDRYTERASLSYVTGSHNMKFGFSNEKPITRTYYHTNGFVNYTFRNGAALFEDQSASSGVGPATLGYTGFGTAWIDFDNDGWLDILSVNGAIEAVKGREGDRFPYDERKLLLRNLGNGHFSNVTNEAGAAFRFSEVSRGAAFGDIDNDGDIDVLVSNIHGPAQLLLNDVGNRNHWIGLKLLDARGHLVVGARVEVVRSRETPNLSSLVRRARADGSYASANDPRVLVGLGKSDTPPDIRVLWPDGRRETWTALPIDRWTTLRQGAGK